MYKTIKKAVIFLTLFLLFISSTILCFAHPNATTHNEELMNVLFEKGYKKDQSKLIQNNINAIFCASNLTIDQYGGYGTFNFTRLQQMNMDGLPKNFSEINYFIDFDSRNGMQINPNNHRKYTHQGWNKKFKNDEANKFLKKRKTILRGTLNSIFGFSFFHGLFGYGAKCDSLAGIIYYVHILGDIDEADTPKKLEYLTDLAGHNLTDGNDIITDLRKFIAVVFSTQKTSREYVNLMEGLADIEQKVKIIYKPQGYKKYTQDEFDLYHQYANDLYDLLKNNIPYLLKREAFFKKRFYPNL